MRPDERSRPTDQGGAAQGDPTAAGSGIEATAADRPLTRAEARALTDTIKVQVERLWESITEANRRGAWLALGYGSWAEYCTAEFGTDRIKIPTSERPAVVSLMAEAGMSLREISAATGMSKSTAANKKRRSSRSTSVQKRTDVDLEDQTDVVPADPEGQADAEPAGAGGPDDPSALPERHDQLVGPVEGAVVSPSPRDWAAEYEEAKRVREDLQHPLASIHVFRTTFRLDKITEIAARDPSFADDVRFHIRCIRKWLRELEKALGDSGSNRAHLRSVK